MAQSGGNSPTEEGQLSPVLRTSLPGRGTFSNSLSFIAEFNTPDAKFYQSHINAQSTPLLLTSLGINNQTAHESWQTCMATPPANPQLPANVRLATEDEDNFSYIIKDSSFISQTELNAITLLEEAEKQADDVTLPPMPFNAKRTLCLHDSPTENGSGLEKTTPLDSGSSKRGRFLYPDEASASFLSETSHSSLVTTTPLRRLPKSKRALPFKAPRRLNESNSSTPGGNKSDLRDGNLTENMTQFPSFATAGGKELKVSGKALELVKKTFTTLESESNETPTLKDEKTSMNLDFNAANALKTPGFATASGKVLQVSETRLKEAQRLYKSVEIPSNIDSDLDFVQNSKEIENCNEISQFEHSKCSEIVNAEIPKMAVGFSTAGGKALGVTAQSLQTAQQQFAGCDVTGLLEGDFGDELNDEEVLLVQNELDALERAGAVVNNANAEHMVGFATARGQALITSEAARKRAENLFKDIEIGQDAGLQSSQALKLEGVVPAAGTCTGFVTAGGKSLFPSEKARKTAEALFKDIGIDEPVLDGRNDKELRISQEEGEVSMTGTSVGLVTDGKMLFGSKRALHKGYELFESIKNDSNASVAQMSSTSSTNTSPVKDIAMTRTATPPASPKLGTRRRKKLVPVSEPEPEFPDPSTESQTIFLEADPTFVKPEVLAGRQVARERQLRSIELKKGTHVKPRPGSLYQQKRNATYRLKDLAPLAPLQSSTDTGTNTWSVTASNAQGYAFSAWEHFPAEIYRENCEGIEVGEDCRLILSDSNSIGLGEISNAFLASEGVDPHLLHPDWLANHYKWIVWKLACLERRFRSKIHCFNPSHVVAQLKYRYDREIDHSQRSVLRKLTEQDDSAQKPMILVVSAVVGIKPCVLEVTDGWYAIKARGDAALARLVAAGKLSVGVKVIIQGAEFASLVEACHPLDLPDHVCLQLSANSMRRVRWDTKLGLISQNLSIKFQTLLKDGGKVAATRARVARCYPLLYVVKGSEGRKEFISERVYNRRLRDEQKREQETMEELYSQVTREFEEQCPLTRFEEEDFMYLSENERREKIKQLRAEQEIRVSDIRDEVRRRADALKKDLGSVTPIWKLFLVSPNWPQAKQTAVVTVWRPTAETQAEVHEGATYHVYNLLPSESKQGSLRLTATYKTRFERVGGSVDLSVKRSVCPLGELREDFRPLANEVDVVGVVASVNPPEEGQQSFVIEDVGWHRAVVYVKGDLESQSLNHFVKVGECVAGLNLTWKGTISNKYSLPCLVFQDVSHLTDRPSQSYLQGALSELRRDLKNSGRF